MKKKGLIIFFSIISLMFGFVAFYGIAFPSYGNNHSTCHSSTGYTIGTILQELSKLQILQM